MDIKHGNYTLKLSGDEKDNVVIFGKAGYEDRWEELTNNQAVQTLLAAYHDSVDLALECYDKIEKVKEELKAWRNVIPFECGCEPAYCRCNSPSSAMSALEEVLGVHEDLIRKLEGNSDDEN